MQMQVCQGESVSGFDCHGRVSTMDQLGFLPGAQCLCATGSVLHPVTIHLCLWLSAMVLLEHSETAAEAIIASKFADRCSILFFPLTTAVRDCQSLLMLSLSHAAHTLVIHCGSKAAARLGTDSTS